MAEDEQATVQAELDAEAARVAMVRSDIADRRRQIEELRVTYAAKQQMIGAAQDDWSAEAARCVTRAVQPEAAVPRGTSVIASAANLSGTLKSKLQSGRLSLRRAVNEVLPARACARCTHLSPARSRASVHHVPAVYCCLVDV